MLMFNVVRRWVPGCDRLRCYVESPGTIHAKIIVCDYHTLDLWAVDDFDGMAQRMPSPTPSAASPTASPASQPTASTTSAASGLFSPATMSSTEVFDYLLSPESDSQPRRLMIPHDLEPRAFTEEELLAMIE